jgi:uncharacterized protein YodC (DUF2158 family)
VKENVADFERNDVVQLIQGSPKMTIDKVSATAEKLIATCKWLDEKGNKKRQDFPVDQLKLIERPGYQVQSDQQNHVNIRARPRRLKCCSGGGFGLIAFDRPECLKIALLARVINHHQA